MYPTLETWLDSSTLSWRNEYFEVSLGADYDEFFARNGDECRWKSVHSDLNDCLINYARDTSKIAHVTLGMHQSFILYDSDGISHWAVSTYYPTPQEILAAGKLDGRTDNRILVMSVQEYTIWPLIKFQVCIS
jgi:hypothetical protein